MRSGRAHEAANRRIEERCRACRAKEDKKPKGARSGGVNMAHRTGEHIPTSSDPQIRSGPSAQPQGQNIQGARQGGRRTGCNLRGTSCAAKKGGVVKNKKKSDWIEKATKNLKEGTLTAAAKRAGYKDVLKFARDVVKRLKGKAKTKAQKLLLKRAVFALNINKRPKGALLGGSITDVTPVCPMDVGTGPRGGTCGRSGPHCRFNC